MPFALTLAPPFIPGTVSCRAYFFFTGPHLRSHSTSTRCPVLHSRPAFHAPLGFDIETHSGVTAKRGLSCKVYVGTVINNYMLKFVVYCSVS